MSRYAVVRLDTNQCDYKFSLWHSDYESAKTEAERLCKKHKGKFAVMEEIGACQIQDFPVVWSHQK